MGEVYQYRMVKTKKSDRPQSKSPLLAQRAREKWGTRMINFKSTMFFNAG
jgi:hypothetical protein